MPPSSRADRTLAVAAAAAHDLNDDLTIILSAITAIARAAGPHDPARPALLDLRAAAQRCAWTASTLLNFTARRGARPSAATVQNLATDDHL